MRTETIIGKLEWTQKFWDDDPDSGYTINGWPIRSELNLDRFDGKKVKITIEEIDEEQE
jgi:hypothetical protein